MLGMVFSYLIETMVKSVSVSHRTSITIQCSARKSKWAPKWASFSLVSEFGKFRIPAVTASLRVKLPKSVFKLSLAVRYSVCEVSSSTVRKTVKFFGLLETRKVGLRLSGCFRKLREKTFHLTDSDADGTISRKDVQRRKLVEPEHPERQKTHGNVSQGNWFLPAHFASKKQQWATVFQVFVLLTLMLASQLGIARVLGSVAFTVTASVVIGLVLNFFGVKNKLSTVWKLWEKAFGVGVLPHPSESFPHFNLFQLAMLYVHWISNQQLGTIVVTFTMNNSSSRAMALSRLGLNAHKFGHTITSIALKITDNSFPQHARKVL